MERSKRERENRRATLRPHPLRDQIVDVMRSYDRPISPTQIARVTGASLGSTAYHVRTLLAAGVVELADEGRVRGAVEHFYALVQTRGGEDVRLTDPVVQLLVLCRALAVADAEGGYPRSVVLNDNAREQLLALVDALRPKVQRIVAASMDSDLGASTPALPPRTPRKRQRKSD